MSYHHSHHPPPPLHGHHAPPPPHQHHHQQNPLSRSQPIASTSAVPIGAPIPVVQIDDDDEDDDDDAEDGHADDDELTDDDEFDPAAAGQIEDVCLVCPGVCRCGGANGQNVVRRDELPSHPLKIRFKLSAPTPAPAQPPTSREYNNISPTAASTTSAYQRTRPLSSSDDDSPRPSHHKKAKLAAAAASPPPPPLPGQVVVIGDPVPPARKKTKKPPMPKAIVSRQSSINQSMTAPLSNALPSRMSLRQVLAMSVRDASGSPAPEEDERPTVHVPLRPDSGKITSDEDSEFETDEDPAMEKAEERALRAEFETASDDSDLSELDDEEDDRRSKKSESSVGADWEAYTKAQERLQGRHSSPGLDEDVELEDDQLGVTQLPSNGGKGVVTWSDYDSVHSSDPESDGDGREGANLAGEFEEELEQLLAISEAVVGPVRDDEFERGEIWFEQITDEERDSGSTADDESEDSDGELDDEATDEENEVEVDGDDRPVVVMEGAWTNSFRTAHDELSGDENGSSAGDSSAFEDEMYFHDEDGGDTTDSLDSDDHVGLVRFGIEVASDAESGDDDYDLQAFLQHAPGTASLADVQAPTSADLASLPAYLFSGSGGFDRSETLLYLNELDTNPEQTILAAALELGVDTDVAARILESVNRSFLKGKAKASLRATLEAEEALVAVAQPSKPSGPAMGTFGPKEGAPVKERSVVIDESDHPAPSPFSTVKKRKSRASGLLDGTPSRRSREQSSKLSTTSVTDGSLSGDMDAASPYNFAPEPEIWCGIDELVDFERDSGGAEEGPVASTSAVPAPAPAPLDATHANGLSDLSRWNKVPIGAFRSSMTPTLFAQPTAMANDAVGQGSNLYHLPIAGLAADKVLRRDAINGGAGKNGAGQGSSRKAVARRMLTSPVFGPVPDGGKGRQGQGKGKKREKKGGRPGSGSRRSSREEEGGGAGGSSGLRAQELPSHALELHSPLFQGTGGGGLAVPSLLRLD